MAGRTHNRAARVVVVEDDPATRSGLAELLASAGYTCFAASDFEEAVTAIHAAAPDLLITDIRLGAKNGLQLVIQHAGGIPAIVITGFADPVLEQEALRAGAIYLRKPLFPRELLQRVHEAINSEGFAVS